MSRGGAKRSSGRGKHVAAPQAQARVRGDRRWLAAVVIVGVLGACVAGAMWSWRGRGPARREELAATRPVDSKAAAPVSFDEYAGSSSCRECHSAANDDWAKSHHALAERPVDPKIDRPAFDPPRKLVQGDETIEFVTSATQPAEPRIVVSEAGVAEKRELRPVRVIGHDPLRQYLIEIGGGRVQSTEAAYDPHKNEWFDVFGANDVRRKGDWGHWTGRGMNWNTMCATCHNTRLIKNYDPASDTYSTRMAEMSIGCESCHGGMKEHVEWQRNYAATTRQAATKPARRMADPTIRRIGREQMFELCGSCHSRRGDLTGDFKPGDSYHDHFQLAIVDESDIYYPDGQIRDEDYEMAAFLGSRMYAAGVRCSDCHHPHTSRPIIDGDYLCMRCHQEGDRTTYETAPIIRPSEHVFHKADGAGARCVSCHMPQTTFMQRHGRHDHGFTVPDPLLTRELGIPNACNRCHTDKDVDWSIAAVDKWYGTKMQRPSRERARAVAAARRGDPAAREPLLAMTQDEKQPAYWKAVAAGLLERWGAAPTVEQTLVELAKDKDALVRANALRSLEPLVRARPAAQQAMAASLTDPARTVRVAAGWALRETLPLDSLAGRDLAAMLKFNSDQPLGQLQMAHWSLARQDLPAAVGQLRKAIEWDPSSAGMRRELAVVLSMAGQTSEAVDQLKEACRLEPGQAEFRYMLGLAYNEVGDLPGATSALQTAVTLDPKHARAWYNLGLARQAAGQSAEALEALAQAEAVNSNGDPAIPYAHATILLQLGRRNEAASAARRALELRPDFAPARELLSRGLGQVPSGAR